MRRRFFALLPAAAFAAAAFGDGLETSQPAVLYDGPSAKSRAQMILSAHYPLRQISRIGGWRKVFTPDDREGWVSEAHVKPAKRAVVVAARAAARVDPHPQAPAVFYAGRGVVLEILRQARGGWLQVLHADGETGYVAAADVWRNL